MTEFKRTIEVKEDEYQGKPVLKLFTVVRGERNPYPFSFGLQKAKDIVDNIDAIKAFVEKNK